jgi:diphthine-ammonia ligase
VIHSDNDFATVAFLRIRGAQLEAKVATTLPVVDTPPLLEDEYLTVYEAANQAQIESPSFRHPKVPSIRSRQVGPWVSISNVHFPSEDSTLKDEVTKCFELLKGVSAPCQAAYLFDIS